MLIKRSIPIILEKSHAVLDTVEEFNRYQKSISESCFNEGSPRNALALHKEVYNTEASSLNSQMRCSSIRLVAGAYQSAKSNKKPAQRPFIFRRKRALFLIGKRGRDASFSKCGKLSISTIQGREKIGFKIPLAFREDFDNAIIRDSLNIGSDGKGFLCITLDVKDPKGVIPVGIDLGIHNAFVASTKGKTLVISGSELSEKESASVKQELGFKLKNLRKRNWAKTHEECVAS